MVDGDLDQQVRWATFEFLRELTERHGEVLPIAPLRQGFVFGGRRVPLLGPQGIFKPAVLPEMPLNAAGLPGSVHVLPLRHLELLDATHIVPDADPAGLPLVSNGLALCKLHRAAFDRHIIGVRPDLVVEIRGDILDEIDGPMLRHGLQELQGARLLVTPSRPDERPNPRFLEERYERFRLAG